MTELRIGVVAEGPTDQIVLRHLLKAYCESARSDIIPIFKDLQPNSDRTSSGSSEGGWREVYRWCRNNPPEARDALFSGPGLFDNDLDDQRHDIILVHMDSDIIAEIGASSSVTPVPTETSTPEQRGTFIRKTLLEWLWPDGAIPDTRHIPAPVVEAIEAWLVAALSDDEQPEAVKTVKRRFIEVYYQSMGRIAPANAMKLKNPRDRYEQAALRCTANIAKVAERCPHFRSLAETLFPAAIP